VREQPTPAPLWAAAAPALPRLPVAWLQALLAEAAECPWLEFKHNHAQPEAIAEYVSALANGAALAGQPHGYLVWGVQDGTRSWVGTTFRPDMARKGNEDLRFWLGVCFRGQTEPEFFAVEEGGLRAVVLRVPAAAARPVAYGGERWMRVRSAKVRLREFPDQERELLERLARTSFEQGVAAEGCTAPQVLDLLDTAAFFRACGEPVPGRWQRSACQAGALGLRRRAHRRALERAQPGCLAAGA
jgi:predicted HTH transcriptional regulator